ncbi:MAG: hypothetical protein JWP36_2867 [Paucimonas sp.]|nr:hypothetical protein [Paucimonas sp.]
MKTDGKTFQVRTGRPVRDDAMPRQPNEHDESADSQQSGPREVMKQAYKDIVSGQQDTDNREQRGVEEVVKANAGKDRAQQPSPKVPGQG